MVRLERKLPPNHKVRLEKLLDHPKDLSRISVGEVSAANLVGLKSTQATVGFIQVYAQARKMARLSQSQLEATLLGKPIPVVIGPDREEYIIDHHHHAASLWVMGFEKAVVEIKEKYPKLSPRVFWQRMRRSKYLHLDDKHGHALEDHHLLPKNIMHLQDNIFQSLAWAARKEGAFTKSAVAVTDF